MTRINRMVMHGFKSFAHNTELVFGDEFNVILGPNGSGKSARWDTEVLLSSGEVKPIGEIVDEALQKSTLQIKLDDGIYTPENPLKVTTWGLDPKTMKIVEKNISAFIKREGEPELYTITTKTGREVTTTGCHPVMVYQSGEIKSEVVRNLRKNQFIATPNKLDFPEKEVKITLEGIKHKEYLTKEIARFMGYLIGDGCIIADRRVDFVNSDEELIDDYTNIIKRIGLRPRFSKRKNTKAITVYANSKEFANSLIKFYNGKYKKEHKHAASQLLFSKKGILSNFLAGLFDCDGSVRKDNPTFEYVTMSKKLADGVLLALLRFGIVARKTIKRKCATNTKDKIKREYYSIAVEGKEKLAKLYNSIPLRCSHKKEALRKWAHSKVIENTNVDLIPQEVNGVIRKCKDILCIPYKPLRKEYPFFASYIENRCCPSRSGLSRAIHILESKFDLFRDSLLGLKLNQKILMSCITKLNLPRVEVAKSMGISRTTITDRWGKGIFNAKPENLRKLHFCVKKEIEDRLRISKELLNLLKYLSNSDVFWDRIVSIKKVKGEKYVYDLTIPNCHNFIGNGIFVHNSNVIDALCFVLGRLSSKSLRAEKSANLIYNGGKTKKPMKQGEVSIYFDNSNKIFPTEDKEVKLTRIIRQDGQSVYRINDKKRTRQQILDLMSVAKIDPEGYNIILQGDIVKFTEMHPEQRRALVEEISGISVYEEKKQKTLNELAKVEEKLKEAEIVLAERKKHLNELKNDRDQAARFRELEGKVKENKASYLYIQIQAGEDEKNKLEAGIKEHQEKIDKIQEEINKLKKEIEEKRKKIADINRELEEKSEKERVSVHHEIEDLKVQLATDKTRLQNFSNEIEKIKLREEQLKNELKDYDAQIGELNSQKKESEKSKETKLKEQLEIGKKIELFKKKHQLDNLDGIEKTIDALDREIEEKTQQAHLLREKQQELLRKKDQMEFQISSIDDQIKKVMQIEKEHQAQIDGLKEKKQEFKKTIAELNNRLNDDSLFARQLGELRKKSSAVQEELAKLNAKNMRIKENLGENLAVTKILAQKNNISGIYGTISELGSVSSEYALALEIAAGPRMNSVIVDSDKVAADCIKYLKKNKFGIVTFIPLNKIKEKGLSAEAKKLAGEKGAHGFAIDLISFDKKYEKAFSYIFGNTLVVDDIDTARKIGIGNARMVTIDGDLAELSGAMQGGYRIKKQKGGFQQKEIVKSIAEQDEIFEKLKQEIDALEKTRIKNEDAITEMRQKRAALEGDIIKTEKALHLDTTDLDASKEAKEELRNSAKEIDKELEELQNKLSEINTLIADAKTKKQQFRSKINELRSPTLIAELNAFEEKKTQLKDELLKIETDIHTISIRFNDMILPEKEKINGILKQQAKEAEKFSGEIKQLSEKIKSDDVLLREKEKASQEFYKRYRNLFSSRDAISDEIQKHDVKVDSLREQSTSVEIKMNEVNLKKAEALGKLAGLQQEFAQYEGVKIDTSRNEEELKEAIAKFEKMVQEIGNVNMRALEIYEEVEKEYNNLLIKKDTLISEQGEVLKMMQEIESKKKDLFMRTFDVINGNFKAVFSQLSTKGEASLVLENPENPFEAGLDIKVRITGAKFLDIRSLSGGEKTLTALAFIFAIQEHEPHSFYILDEVDAALDKHNSEKLSKLIRKYANKAQYLMISHNEAIYSEADNLYGVSMDEHGVSKVVSLKL